MWVFAIGYSSWEIYSAVAHPESKTNAIAHLGGLAAGTVWFFAMLARMRRGRAAYRRR